MDILEFISHSLSAVSWPTAAVLIVVLLRVPLEALLAELRKFKWMGLEAEFEKNLGQARELIELAPASKTVSVTGAHFPQDQRDWLLKLAELSPRSLVIEAWRQVEDATAETMRTAGARPSVQREINAAGASKELLGAGLLSDDERQIYSILKNLRNQAVHERSFKLTQSDAVEFAIMAQRLASALKTIPASRAKKND